MSFTVFSIVGGKYHGKTLATDEPVDVDGDFEIVESSDGPRIVGVATAPQKRALRTIELPSIPDGSFVKPVSDIPPL